MFKALAILAVNAIKAPRCAQVDHDPAQAARAQAVRNVAAALGSHSISAHAMGVVQRTGTYTKQDADAWLRLKR